jgi:NAD(P)-dependent dehydrogenase (short-subunit alcohol dehydrogenase family)
LQDGARCFRLKANQPEAVSDGRIRDAAATVTRHALVTGGSRGIGRAIAGALAAAGARVTVLGRDENALGDVVKAGQAQDSIVADVSDAAAMEAALRRVQPVDLLIANAGVAVSGPFLKTGDDGFARMIATNLMGTVHAARGVLAGMVERGFGRIVAVASTAGLKGYPYVSAYCASKHAVVGLARALAAETAGTGVTVNAVCPGFTDTEMVEQSLERIVAKTGRSRAEALRELTKLNPQQRLVQPREVADAVLWLCSDGASAVTGQAIAVAGGEL